jgi:hypothetical protein
MVRWEGEREREGGDGERAGGRMGVGGGRNETEERLAEERERERVCVFQYAAVNVCVCMCVCGVVTNSSFCVSASLPVLSPRPLSPSSLPVCLFLCVSSQAKKIDRKKKVAKAERDLAEEEVRETMRDTERH